MANPSKEYDGILLQRLREGDRQAFSILYERYSGRIYGNILRLVKEKEPAQELLQDVFMKLWEKRETITIETSFTAYLFAISKHLVLNMFRRISIEHQAAARLRAVHSELYQHVEEHVEYKEAQKALQQAIDNLPARRREIYLLVKTEGNSYEQVSNLLGISRATVNDHVVKANRHVYGHLSRSGLISIALMILLAV